jgi:hypothetical protein
MVHFDTSLLIGLSDPFSIHHSVAKQLALQASVSTASGILAACALFASPSSVSHSARLPMPPKDTELVPVELMQHPVVHKTIESPH